MIFQPGFSAHSQWFKDGGLRKLIDDGTKICVSAYAESELPDELFISKFFGFGTTLSSVVENPYSFGSLKQAGEPKFLAENKWGSLLWQLERRPAPAVEFSDRYVYAVDVVQSQAEAVGLNGMDAMIAYNNSLRSFGVLVAKGMVPALPDMNDSEEMVSLPQECMVLTSCGKVFDLWLERFVDGVVIPPNVIQSYRIQSENGTFTFARLLWSIWVFRDFVEAPLKRQRLC